jgi:hypothetical protein
MIKVLRITAVMLGILLNHTPLQGAETVHYGYYSQHAADRIQGQMADGSRPPLYSIWKTPDGREVITTAVYDTPDMQEVKRTYRWDDVMYVGPVTTWVRNVQ